MMVKMAFYLGLRRREISYASVDYIDKVNKLYHVPNHSAKNGSGGPVPIPDHFYGDLIRYVNKYGLRNWLFLSRCKTKCSRLGAYAVTLRFNKYRKLAGLDMLKGISKSGKKLKAFRFHDFRSTYATKLQRNGVNLKVIQNLLRHKHLTSTCRYLMESDISLRSKVVNMVFGS